MLNVLENNTLALLILENSNGYRMAMSLEMGIVMAIQQEKNIWVVGFGQP